jgi:hypothetical protein
MTRKHLLPLAVALTVVALLVCAGPQAQAAEPHHHYTIKVMPRAARPDGQAIHPNVTLALNGVQQSFVGTPYSDPQVSSNVLNSDSTEVWPCFGSYDGSTPSTENPDCEFFKDTNYSGLSPAFTVGLPTGAGVLGIPSYTWSLADCDATSSTTLPCGQTATWYEDNSNDSTDDLLYEIEVVQGTSVIADSGLIDFCGGTGCLNGNGVGVGNPYGGLSPAADVVIYGDQNFGTMGVTGKNNGNCDASFNYPVTSNPAGGEFGIAANKTCVAPVAGVATITATTELATPTYKLDSAKNCATAGVSSPCYTVTFAKKYSVLQKWTINLE